jgi:DNA end-binding protein Ku
MAARPIGSATISFGLVSIPVKLYTATSSQSISFNQLHPKCGGRIKQQLYCPVDDEVVDRNTLVKGYEYAKDQYVTFSPDELKALEAQKTDSLNIVEFVPLDRVDLLHVERSMYLGPDKGGAKAYQLLAKAMLETGRVAIGRYWSRGQEQLVLIRPYREGLILHTLYYADEVRAYSEVPLGDKVEFRKGEPEMARQLVEQLSADDFKVGEYKDEYRERLLEAIEQKVAGKEIVAAPEQPQAQIIDIFEALKASLQQTTSVGEIAAPAAGGPKKAEPKVAAKTAKKKAGSG